MTVTSAYLNRISEDIHNRINRVLINGEIEADILNVSFTDNQATLVIGGIGQLSAITLVEVFDETDNKLSEKTLNIAISTMEIIELEMSWEVQNT